LSSSGFFGSDCAPPLNGEAGILPAWLLLNEKGEEVDGLVGADGKPPIGALNPNTGALVAVAVAGGALGALVGAGVVVDPTVDEPPLGPKKLGIVELPDGAGADDEAGFEGSGCEFGNAGKDIEDAVLVVGGLLKDIEG